MSTSERTPGQILSDLVGNHGWTEFTVEFTDPGEGLSTGSFDLGNGHHVYGFISQMTDPLYGRDGAIDLAASNFGDWTNLSADYTGQHGNPDSMHDSEIFIGKIAEDAAAQIGEYAIPYIMWEDSETTGEDFELFPEGWAILHRNIFI